MRQTKLPISREEVEICEKPTQNIALFFHKEKITRRTIKTTLVLVLIFDPSFSDTRLLM